VIRYFASDLCTAATRAQKIFDPQKVRGQGL
jgi:hypothetical protein